MKIIKLIFILLITTMTLSSCSDFLDVNDDVNNPASELIEPNLILPAAQNGTFIAISTRQNQFGNIMMNQWAGDVTNFTGGNSAEYNYDISTNFYSGIWDNLYVATGKMQDIINKDSEANTYYTAIAKIIKSHNMQNIVDIYGNAPYSEAFQRGENYQPAYDNAKDIYMAIYADLDAAISLIDDATSVAINPEGTDVMLGGDMDMWKKFANTIKLKLLVRANSSSDGAMQTWVTSKFAELTGSSFLGAGETIKINPGYAKESGRQNPYYQYFGFKVDDTPQSNNNFTCGSEYFVNYLQTTGDARLGAFFTQNSVGGYQGIEQGADDPDNPDDGLSFIGASLLRGHTQDGWFFTAAESLFLQAEAVLNGNLSGNAQQLYEDGIADSFNLLQKSSDAAGYIGGVDAVSTESIITQKWIALHGTNGAESYIEHLRTGFPNPPLPTLTSDTHRPYRLMYPQSEFTGNGNNVIAFDRTELFVPSLFYQQ